MMNNCYQCKRQCEPAEIEIVNGWERRVICAVCAEAARLAREKRRAIPVIEDNGIGVWEKCCWCDSGVVHREPCHECERPFDPVDVKCDACDGVGFKLETKLWHVMTLEQKHTWIEREKERKAAEIFFRGFGND